MKWAGRVVRVRKTRKMKIRCDARRQKTKRSEHPIARANILLRRQPKILSLLIDWHDQQYTFAPAFSGNRHYCLEEIEFLGEKTSFKMKMKMKTKNLGHRMHFFVVSRGAGRVLLVLFRNIAENRNLSRSESIADPGVLRLLGAT